LEQLRDSSTVEEGVLETPDWKPGTPPTTPPPGTPPPPPDTPPYIEDIIFTLI